MEETYRAIPIDAIDGPKNKLREEFDDEYICELMRSMSDNDLIHPIRVSDKSGRYEVITGACRTEAARRLGWATIKALVTDASEEKVLLLQIHENLHRLDNKPTEQAKRIKTYSETLGWTTTRIAAAMGKSIKWVQERLEMNFWPEGLTELVDAKKVSIGVAQALMTVEDDKAFLYMSRQAAESGATLAQVRAWIQNHNAHPWSFPSANLVEAAEQAMAPAQVPLAYCGGCTQGLAITLMVTTVLCPNCTILLPELSKRQLKPIGG